MSEASVVMEKANRPHLSEARDISMVYFSTGLTILIIATLLGFLNRFAQTGVLEYGNISSAPKVWYTLMTLHGMAAFVGWGVFVCLGMVFYILTHSLDTGLANPRYARISYVLFVIGFALIIIATLFGNFGGSWVFLFPIIFFGYWESWATSMWTLGVIFAGLGIILANLEVILTIRKAGHSFIAALGFEAFKPKPKDGYKVPTPVVPIAVNAIGMIIATVPFAVLLLIFLFKSLTGAGPEGIDAIVAKNVLWWFGHPVVYALLFPVAGMAYYMAMRITKSNIVGEQITKITWAVAFIIQNIIGSHHMYQDIVQPLPIQISQQLLTYTITLPSVSSLFVIFGTLYARKFEWDLPVKYLYLAALGWLLAGMSGVVNATILLNTFIHNTLWVVAHFHTMALLNITMMIFGAAYFLIQDYSGKEIYSVEMGNRAMWFKYIGVIGMVHMWFLQGIQGGLRRSFTSSPGLGVYTWLSIPFALLALVGIWMAAWNLYKTVVGDSAAATDAAAAGGD
ncbi:MAG: cbb3-type cytochrome c oxidase subunit I [Candidatus Kariarchaeaceae archaeon]|jgi:cytochrome c oxidase subunit 1